MTWHCLLPSSDSWGLGEGVGVSRASDELLARLKGELSVGIAAFPSEPPRCVRRLQSLGKVGVMSGGLLYVPVTF